MRVLIDYRAALRSPSGVGEFARQLVQGLAELSEARAHEMEVTLFSSSWKDRLAPPPGLHVSIVDQRIPVKLLNFAWHRLEWPPAEALAESSFDIVHSLHPLLMPARAAAQVITIHDLNFLRHPERTTAEIRRDYPELAREHALRADQVIVPSAFTAREVEDQLGVPRDRISICSPGRPDWNTVSECGGGDPPDEHGYMLFFGTLEPRKNVGALLDAYELLLADRARRASGASAAPVPDLLLAGRAAAGAEPWLERLRRPPLAGHVRHIGYVEPCERQRIYQGARVLVQPSFEEGFGLPPLEAMAAGVPVVAADRGASPEVVGGAGLLVNPEDPAALAGAIARILDDPALARSLAAAGVARARSFPPSALAARAVEAYAAAIAHHAGKSRLP
jgi:glycosyltransferase involved in cell wall biosynthesis